MNYIVLWKQLHNDDFNLVEFDQIKTEYGKQIIKELSKELRNFLGTGFSVSNLFNMRKFYIIYPKFQILSGKLSWLHYLELLSIENNNSKAIGIILCKSKVEILMEYALGGLSNNIFASTYTYYIPCKEELISEIEKVIDSMNE